MQRLICIMFGLICLGVCVVLVSDGFVVAQDVRVGNARMSGLAFSDDDADDGTNGGSASAVSCPAGFIDMGNFCIEPEPRPEQLWLDAAETCTDAGYTLCHMAELTSACRLSPTVQATLPPPSPVIPPGVQLNGGEFVDSLQMTGDLIAHGVSNACLSNRSARVESHLPVAPSAVFDKRPFRCCADKR